MKVKELKKKANLIRISIIEMLHKSKSGHTGGALGLTDIFTVLYFDILNIKPTKPKDPNRDFLLLSNGHTCPVLYATLAQAKFFPKKELETLRQIDSRLQGHPHNNSVPGVENSGGPLGQGLSQAVGLAAALKRDKKKNFVYVVVGDGEIQEGQCWEALLFAQKEKLDNLIVIIDKNNIQIDGTPQDVIHLDRLVDKIRAFNCKTIEFDGNDINQIKAAIVHAKNMKDSPTVLIANTIPGKGVSFMQDDYHWHGKTPNDQEKELALKELEEEKRRLK